MMTKLDANQVIKSVFDETTGALKTVPASQTSFAIELSSDDGDSVETRSQAIDTQSILSAVTAGSNITSSNINILNYQNVYVASNWLGLNAVNAEIQIQGSLDNLVWFNEGSSIVLSSASGNQLTKLTSCGYKFIRINYTANSNTTGTVTVKYVAKG